MFDMENLGKMMEQAKQFQKNYQDELDRMAIHASSGGDSVSVVVNGNKEVTKIEFSESAVKNPALLADLVLSALSSAYTQVDEQMKDRMPGNMNNMLSGVDLNGIMDMFKK